MLGLILVTMVTTTLLLWEEIPQKSCADLIDANEFAPYIFEPGSGNGYKHIYMYMYMYMYIVLWNLYNKTTLY